MKKKIKNEKPYILFHIFLILVLFNVFAIFVFLDSIIDVCISSKISHWYKLKADFYEK